MLSRTTTAPFISRRRPWIRLARRAPISTSSSSTRAASGFRDRDGEPLIKWTTAEEAFDAFGEMTRGRLCDYSGLSHDRLRGSPGIQWPCNESHPDGTERLYTDHVFETFIEECEEYGHDFLTGAARERKEFADLNPAGRAILHGVEYVPPAEEPSNDLPLRLSPGARSTTSTRARRRAASQSSTRPHRTCGSSSRR